MRSLKGIQRSYMVNGPHSFLFTKDLKIFNKFCVCIPEVRSRNFVIDIDKIALFIILYLQRTSLTTLGNIR